MPFQIIRNDITKVSADAIVNTANPHPAIGAGTDSAVYKAAGAERLLTERKKIGDIDAGKAAVTPAFDLNSKYIIHTVGPAWIDGAHGEMDLLRSCYRESLRKAEELSCKSVAFPLIATGVYGFPKDLAIGIATSEIYSFLLEHDMMVYLVVFDRKAFDLSGKLFRDIQEFIDENYVDDQKSREYTFNDGLSSALMEEREEKIHFRRRNDAKLLHSYDEAGTQTGVHSLDDFFGKAGMTFQEYLLELIIKKDMSNPEVYHGANLTKQHFSKIISNKHYNPSKNTVCALAISLHLDPAAADKLLASAGFALSNSSKFDLCIEYFLRNGMYNIVDDNIILYENGLELLGKH